ncbi:MAG: hypothetical protein AAFV88_24460 [Planctomycetota bacterium]
MENSSDAPASKPVTTDAPIDSPSTGDPADHGSKEQWGTRIGVILAVAGSAVGLGNFLRFPGQVAENGGGAFMLPYFISLLVIGIPLCWAEWTMGRFGGARGFNSSPGVFCAVCRTAKARYFAVPALLIPLVIYMYYVVIEAWCLSYAFSYLNGSLMLGEDSKAYETFFNDFTGASKDGAVFGGTRKVIEECFVGL